MAFNPEAGEFVPGQWGAPVVTQPPAQPTQPPKESWEEEAIKEAPVPIPASAAAATGPTSSTLKLDDGDIEDDVEDEEEKVKAVERKLKKLDWGSNDGADPREHLNIVFIGHVDAGKSTCSGQILFLTGMVDERTIAKYKQDSASQNRGSWFLAYIMDTIEEERAKGKTVEVGRAHYETEKKRYTILDAPGHKNYVPNMIMGVSQADIGVLVVSARKGEFEAGFDRNGQTREHAILAKTLGVKRIIIAVNKMDDWEPAWDKSRYDTIVEKITTFLKGIGYAKGDIIALPISGLGGVNIKEKIEAGVCSWYQGDSLIGTLDNMPPLPRMKDAPLRIPILDKYKDMGILNLIGKVEAGRIRVGQSALIMPGNMKVEVAGLANDMTDVGLAEPGENIRVIVRGVDEDVIHKGFVICEVQKPIPVVTEFVAQVKLLELIENKALFTAGYSAVVHIHTAVEECSVVRLLAEVDAKTGEKTKKLPKFVKSRALVDCHIKLSSGVPMELFKDFQQLGRFTLRDEGKTIGFGKVLALGPPLKKAKPQ